ncbi:DUF3343 domain-containing protein [Clostridiaceae bacterium M8S5]|nr:DUF3343 domain-containing protein [Clostridiaceae bacterium M8S5]
MQYKNINYRDYYFVIFKSRNQAIQLYYTMEKKRTPFFQLISTPCHIRAGCNYAIKFSNLNHYNILKNEAKLMNVELDEVYRFYIMNGKRTYDNITSSVI